MILLLDTSTPICYLTFVIEGKWYEHEWRADRDLSRKLHAYIRESAAEHGMKLRDVTSIGVMKGPGSFTGLRIGLTVMNTMASALDIPIVGISECDNWRQQALDSIESGDNHQVVLPEYGRDANTTNPRK